MAELKPHQTFIMYANPKKQNPSMKRGVKDAEWKKRQHDRAMVVVKEGREAALSHINKDWSKSAKYLMQLLSQELEAPPNDLGMFASEINQATSSFAKLNNERLACSPFEIKNNRVSVGLSISGPTLRTHKDSQLRLSVYRGQERKPTLTFSALPEFAFARIQATFYRVNDTPFRKETYDLPFPDPWFVSISAIPAEKEFDIAYAEFLVVFDDPAKDPCCFRIDYDAIPFPQKMCVPEVSYL